MILPSRSQLPGRASAIYLEGRRSAYLFYEAAILVAKV
jgi:hypothetical protein